MGFFLTVVFLLYRSKQIHKISSSPPPFPASSFPFSAPVLRVVDLNPVLNQLLVGYPTKAGNPFPRRWDTPTIWRTILDLTDTAKPLGPLAHLC